MSDIATVWSNASGRGDYMMAGADLAAGADLQTSILMSLFSNRTCRPEDVIPDGSDDRQGWWGDEGELFPVGSRLWLLDRSKLTEAVAKKARDYAAEALQWMIDDGAVAEFSFATTIKGPNQLWLSIAAYRTKGNKTAKNYAWTWNGPVIYSSLS